MSTYYVNPADGGSNSGTLANPWTSLQSFFDNASSGDVCYAQGTETLSSALALDTAAGVLGNECHVIGTNSSWVDDGTVFTIDADSTAANCVYTDEDVDYIFKNVTFTNGTGDGFDNSYETEGLVFVNCAFTSHGGAGFAGPCAVTGGFYQCNFASNTSHGLSDSRGPIIGCRFIGNGGDGMLQTGGIEFICSDTVFHNNTAEGATITSTNATFQYCTFDSNGGDGLEISGELVNVISCRFTNNTSDGIELSANTATLMEGYNAFFNNGAEIDAGSGTVKNVGTDTSMAADGYVDSANDNFNLTDVAEATDQSITVGTGSTNLYLVNAGQADGTAPTFAGITSLECLSDGGLLAKWSAATKGNVDTYNLYIRAGSASVFSATYLIGKIRGTLTEAVIRTTAANSTLLADGTTYYVGVKAENGGFEDTNTATFSQKTLGIKTPFRMPVSAELT